MDELLTITGGWDHTVFARLMASSPRKAFEYRLRTTGTPIPDEWLTSEDKAKEIEIIDVPFVPTKIEEYNEDIVSDEEVTEKPKRGRRKAA